MRGWSASGVFTKRDLLLLLAFFFGREFHSCTQFSPAAVAQKVCGCKARHHQVAWPRVLVNCSRDPSSILRPRLLDFAQPFGMREDAVRFRTPPLCCILSPRGLKVATAGGEQEQKRGEGREGGWRAQSASPLGENKTPFPTMISHPPRGREGGREEGKPQKDPHPLISPTLFSVWSFVLFFFR